MATDAISKDLWNFGFLHGIRKLVRDGKINLEQALAIKKTNVERILTKLDEADREAKGLVNSIAALKNACRSSLALNYPVAISEINELRMAVDKLDLWMASLVETQLSLLAVIRNPDTAGRRIDDFRQMMAEIVHARAVATSNDMLNVKVKHAYSPTMYDPPY